MTMRGRGQVLGAVIGVVVLLAGCDGDGKADPAPSPSPTASPAPPEPVPVSDLDGLLLSAGDINQIMGSTSMELTAPTQGMADDSENYDPQECTTIGGARQKKLYEGRGWLSIQGRQLREPGDMWQHYVSESVVAFNTADQAETIFDEAHKQWSACAERNFTWTGSGGRDIN